MKKTFRNSIQHLRQAVMVGALMLIALCFFAQAQAQTDTNTQKKKEQHDQLIEQTCANTMKMMEEARKKGEKIAEPAKSTSPFSPMENGDKNSGVLIEKKDQSK